MSPNDPKFQQWITMFDEMARRTPLDNETSQLMLRCMLAEQQQFVADDVLKEMPSYTIVTGWAKGMGLRLSDALALYIAAVSATPGVIVMLLSSIADHAIKNDVTDYRFSDFVNMMPHGMPTSNDMGELWDAQKLGSGANMLDAIEWQS